MHRVPGVFEKRAWKAIQGTNTGDAVFNVTTRESVVSLSRAWFCSAASAL